MPEPYFVDDDEAIIAGLLRRMRRLEARLATTFVHGTHDEFTVAATPETTFQLTYIPVDGTCAMYKAGTEQEEGTAYTVDYSTGIVTFVTALTTGQRINFRYLITDWLVARSLPPETGAPDAPVATVGAGRFGAGNTSAHTVNFTPSPNTLLLACLSVYTNSLAFTPTITDTVGGLTWTNLTTGWQALGGGANCLRTDIWWAFTGASPPTGDVTFGENVSFEGNMRVFEIPGADPVSPIGASGFALANGAGNTSLAVTLGSAPAANSLVFATYLDNFTSPASPSAPSGYTLLDYDSWTLGFDIAAAYAHDASSPGASVASWGFAALPGTGYGVQSLAVEIKGA